MRRKLTLLVLALALLLGLWILAANQSRRRSAAGTTQSPTIATQGGKLSFQPRENEAWKVTVVADLPKSNATSTAAGDLRRK